MGERDLLLRSVLGRPDDDLPRLVFADWLEENGEGDRAEFIRAQVEIALIPPEPPWCGPHVPIGMLQRLHDAGCDWCRWSERYRKRSDALVCRVLSLAKLGEARGWAARPAGIEYWAMSRGFARNVYSSIAAYLANAGALFAAHPVVRVGLTDRAAWQLGGMFRYNVLTGRVALPRPRLALENHYFLPPELHDPGHFGEAKKVTDVPNGHWITYQFATREDGYDWVSERCVRYGRRLAELPEWTPPLADAAPG